MKKIQILVLLFLVSVVNAQKVQSPSKSLTVNFGLDNEGKPNYYVTLKDKKVVNQSFLGLKLKDGTDFTKGFTVENSNTSTFDEVWKPVLGEQSAIRNNYNELVITLVQKANDKKLSIIFRVFDEGVAFRYSFTKQPNLNYFVISD